MKYYTILWILLVIAFVPSCCVPKIPKIPTSAMEPVNVPIELYTLNDWQNDIFDIDVLFSSKLESNLTKKKRDEQAKNRLTEIDVPRPPYVVRLRVIIEKDEFGVPARTNSEIAKDLDLSHKLFRKIYLNFYIVEIVNVDISKFDSHSETYKKDAEIHKESISVYYIYNDKWFEYYGQSAFPWSKDKYGIFVRGDAGDFTLAHELGHYFGLIHTFEEFTDNGDCVQDTIDKKDWESDVPYHSYNNIMNYNSSNKKTITLGQLERMRFFLTLYRSHHLLRLDKNKDFEIIETVNSSNEME